jgi:cytochrome c oxidase cbb3-type subunit III
MPAPGSRRRFWALSLAAGVTVLGVLALAVSGFAHVQDGVKAQKLLAAASDVVVKQKDLVRFAVSEARPLFAKNCAACHGADMKGVPGVAPNLTDQTWLYGTGDVFSIERTILYGVRSTQQKSRNVTEMPAFGLRGQLSDDDIKNVVQYVLELSHQPYDAQAALAGQKIYNGPASCSDCHDADGRGNSDYGSPDLTANVWIYGGDPQSLYNSIYFGRHAVMPAWIDKLTLPQIRALAVYIYVVSHPEHTA